MPDVAVIVYLLCLVEKQAARAVMSVISCYDSLYPRLSITLEVLLITVSQGIRIIQSNTSFLLLKYTYIQGYMFQLLGAIIRLLP